MKGLFGLLALAAVAAGSAVAAYVITKKKEEKRLEEEQDMLLVDSVEDILDDAGTGVEPSVTASAGEYTYPEPDSPAAEDVEIVITEDVSGME